MWTDAAIGMGAGFAIFLVLLLWVTHLFIRATSERDSLRIHLDWERQRGRERAEAWKARESDLEETGRALWKRLDASLAHSKELTDRIISMQKLGYAHVPTLPDDGDAEPYAITNELELEIERSRREREAGEF